MSLSEVPRAPQIDRIRREPRPSRWHPAAHRPTDTYKVSISATTAVTRRLGQLTVSGGPDALAKARLCADIVFGRLALRRGSTFEDEAEAGRIRRQRRVPRRHPCRNTDRPVRGRAAHRRQGRATRAKVEPLRDGDRAAGHQSGPPGRDRLSRAAGQSRPTVHGVLARADCTKDQGRRPQCHGWR